MRFHARTGYIDLPQIVSTYRWWTVGGGFRPDAWLKLGPLTITSYRWSDDRLRVSWLWLGVKEHMIWGGPLA